MNTESIHEVAKALEPLAVKMGVVGATVYGWARQQVLAETVEFAIWAVVMAVASVLFLRLALWARSKIQSKYDQGDYPVIMAVGYACSVTAGVLSVVFVGLFVKHLVCPDWQAVALILKAVAGGE